MFTGIGKHWGKLLFAIAVVAFLYVLARFPGPPEPQPRQMLVKSSDKSAPVHVDVRLNSNRVEGGGNSELTVDVQNNLEHAMNNVILRVDAPGFAKVKTDSAEQLASHERYRHVFALTASETPASLGITTSIEWQQQAPADSTRSAGVTAAQSSKARKRSQASPPLVRGSETFLFSPVVIERSRTVEGFARLGRRLKDLALPLIAALVGYFFTRSQNERSERQEVSRLLLTRVMDLARGHYLPFVSHTKNILSEAHKIKAGGTAGDPQRLFFHVLLLLKRMEVFRLTEGGMFFKSRDGEKCLGAAWLLLKINFYAGLGGDLVVTKSLKFVQLDWDYAAYVKDFPAFHAAWRSFQVWIQPAQPFWKMLGVLDVFQAVMSFEADKALSEYWYEQKSTPDFDLQEPTELYRVTAPDGLSKAKLNLMNRLLIQAYKRKTTLQ